MSSTRHQPPIDVYMDRPTSLTGANGASSRTQQSYGGSSSGALRQARNSSLNATIKFQPTRQDQPSLSPLKHSSSPLQPPPQMSNADLLGVKHFPPPAMSYMQPQSPMKQPLPPNQYPQIIQRPSKAVFPTFPSAKFRDRENFIPANPYLYTATNASATFRDGYRASVLGKHSLSDIDTPRERPSKKPKQELEDEKPFMLPEPEDMPPVKDEGGRPPYSYATLIGMAILRAPNRRLTLSNIYKWISDTFEFYRNADTGWTNSIRHNLSLNKAFTKIEKPKEDPGKGHYWIIEPGMERQFVKDKATRRPGQGPSSEAFYSDDPRPSSSHHDHIDSSRFPAEASSDGTIPASDPVVQEQEQEQPNLPAAGPCVAQSSPSHINSSPPVARHGTPPPVMASFPALSRSGGRRKHVDSFRDSGFFSSIESSAPRPHFPLGIQFSSPVAQERSIPKKHGRAEDEIARIRGSSYDPSPIKSKPVIKYSAPSLLSSSPLRNEELLSFPPLTPGDNAAAPSVVKPPPTASPGTHLRRHRQSIRDLIGTPAHGLSALREELHFTPQFDIHNDQTPAKTSIQRSINKTAALIDDDVPEFLGLPIFDPSESPALTMPLDDYDFDVFFARGSPMRSATKRPGLQRSATTTGTCVLSEITNTKRSKRLASPIAFDKPALSKVSGISPSKGSISIAIDDDLPSPLKDLGDAAPSLWGFDTLASEGDENSLGLDLTKGFGKIGSQTLEIPIPDGKENEFAAPPPRKAALKASGGAAAARGNSRPAFGRSLTNVF